MSSDLLNASITELFITSSFNFNFRLLIVTGLTLSSSNAVIEDSNSAYVFIDVFVSKPFVLIESDSCGKSNSNLLVISTTAVCLSYVSLLLITPLFNLFPILSNHCVVEGSNEEGTLLKFFSL